MPGSPPTTPRWGLPRYAQSDDAIFADDINPIVDLIDNAAKLTELNAETSRAEAAEAAEMSRAEAAEAAETARAEAAEAAEMTARIAGDAFRWVNVAAWKGDQAPTTANGVLVGLVPVPVLGSETLTLVGVASRCVVLGSTPSMFDLQTDHGHGDGSLADIAGLTAIEPVVGRFVLATPSAALTLNDLDTLALKCVTQGNSLGCALALVFGRAAP